MAFKSIFYVYNFLEEFQLFQLNYYKIRSIQAF